MGQCRILRGEAPPADDVPCSSCKHYKAMRDTGNFVGDEGIRKSRNEYHMPYAIGRLGMRIASRLPGLARWYVRSTGLTK